MRTDPDFAVLSREPMFGGARYYHNRLFAQYDVNPSDDRLVVLRRVPDQLSTEGDPVVILATHWFEELRRLMRIGER